MIDLSAYDTSTSTRRTSPPSESAAAILAHLDARDAGVTP